MHFTVVKQIEVLEAEEDAMELPSDEALALIMQSIRNGSSDDEDEESDEEVTDPVRSIDASGLQLRFCVGRQIWVALLLSIIALALHTSPLAHRL